jgi:hypothetical protein
MALPLQRMLLDQQQHLLGPSLVYHKGSPVDLLQQPAAAAREVGSAGSGAAAAASSSSSNRTAQTSSSRVLVA